MSGDGVDEVEKPDQGQAQQKSFGDGPGPLNVPDGGSHAPQGLQVEGAEEER